MTKRNVAQCIIICTIASMLFAGSEGIATMIKRDAEIEGRIDVRVKYAECDAGDLQAEVIVDSHMEPIVMVPQIVDELTELVDESIELVDESTEDVIDNVVDNVVETECIPIIEIETQPDIIEPRYYWNQYEIEMLQKLVYAEVGTEDLECMMWVARIVINRVESPYFPNTIQEVIMQYGQFSVVTNGSYQAAPLTEQALMAVTNIQYGWDATYGALYFTSHPISWSNTYLVYQRPTNFGTQIYFWSSY